MEASGEKRQCRCKAFKQIPHLFKPLQVIGSIAIFICAVTTGIYNEPLWRTALASLLISEASTVIIFLGIQHKLVERYFCGKLSWDAVEFLYSAILAFFWATSAVDSFGRVRWYSAWIQYLIGCILSVIMFVSYLVPIRYIVRKELKILMAESSPVHTSTTVAESKPAKTIDVAEYAADLESLLDN